MAARLLAITIGAGAALLFASARAQNLPTASPAPDQNVTDATTGPASSVTSRLYGGIDYLHWWVKGAPLSVPLISTGPVANKEGFLINSNTTIVYGAPLAPALGGNDTQNFPGFSGGRLTVGYWLDDRQSYAVEASGFLLQSQTTSFQVQGNSNGSPGMRVPVFNTIAYAPGGACDQANPSACLIQPQEDGVPLSIPNELTGGASVTNSLQLGEFDLTGVVPLLRNSSWQVSGLAGGTFLQLNEGLNLTTNLAGVATSSAFAGQSGFTVDQFKTRNRFYGATVGLRAHYSYGPMFVEGTGRVSLGASQEALTVNGGYEDFGATFAHSSGPYGIFAMPANEGKFTQSHFAVVPQAQIKVGYNITPAIAITLGYDFLYDSNIIRPGDQISRYIPKGQTYQQDGTAPSLTSPARLFSTTGFFAQGVSIGLVFRL